MRSRFNSSHKNNRVSAVVACLVFAMLVVPLVAFAQDSVSSFFSTIIFKWLIAPLTELLNLLIILLIKVASYNQFTTEPIVDLGWKTLRDVSNMFFVLILLIVAIGTIIKWDVVNYRQNLRRLILMALLINFSRTIAAFLIDFSQVITLTFIKAVQDVIQAGIVGALGLDKILNPVTLYDAGQKGGAVGQLTINIFTYIVALIMVGVACVVVAAYVLIFAVRIIALWLLIIFSPLAYLASTLKGTSVFQWYDRWWKTFVSNLSVAPVLAFCLWLVFSIVAKGGGTQQIIPQGTEGDAVTVNGVSTTVLLGFMVGTGLLIYSIRLAMSMAGETAKLGSQFVGKMGGYAQKAGDYLKWGKSGQGGVLGRYAKRPALAVAEGVGRAAQAVPGLGRVGVTVTAAAQRAQRRQADTRKKAESELMGPMYEEATPEQRERIMARAGRGPRRKALIELEQKRLNEKDESGNYRVSDADVLKTENQYILAGASEKELKDFRKATHMRGMKERVKSAPSDERAQAAQKELNELTLELNQEGKLTSDKIFNNPAFAIQLLLRTKSVSQINSSIKDLESPDKKEVLDVMEQQVRALKAKEAKGLSNAEKNEMSKLGKKVASGLTGAEQKIFESLNAKGVEAMTDAEMNDLEKLTTKGSVRLSDPEKKRYYDLRPRQYEGLDTTENKDLSKLSNVIAKNDTPRAAQLAADEKIDPHVVTSNMEDTDYNDFISHPNFEKIAHKIDPSFMRDAIQTKKVTSENKTKLVEEVTVAAGSPDAAKNVPAQRAMSAALNNEQTRQETKDYLDNLQTTQPAGYKAIQDYENKLIQDKAKEGAKKEHVSDVERLLQRYKKDDVVLAPPGKDTLGAPNDVDVWVVENIDKVNKTVDLMQPATGGGMFKKKMPLQDFKRYNFF
ncbi:MAG: hypothetical protein A3B30_01130 [Candidatus Komeilibacteria bacterium RIFCSPLOWO2_01_FULL_52_15]|uniref:Uncharacterized protein n=1 Tax=Candidatus Komeilibacteria bacterium RIFCSPLOWO2_01_FULL_52_15 TaxID=1798551 RepID=A0A1G2BRQ6_9BACT|nr:MAG: hypothetical protein A3B30_01130 [Candidatus Komeilibacteria bacterium RIFCSPLOWO2_01_FULL_52_15]